MRNFKEFVQSRSPKITINLDKYLETLQARQTNVVLLEDHRESTDTEKALADKTLADLSYPHLINFLLTEDKIQACRKVKECLGYFPPEVATFWAKLHGAKGLDDDQIFETLHRLTAQNMEEIRNIIGKPNLKSSVNIQPITEIWTKPAQIAQIDVAHAGEWGRFLCDKEELKEVLNEYSENFHENKILQEDFFLIVSKFNERKYPES